MTMTNAEKFVACLIGPMQAIEDAFQQLLSERTVDRAVGAQLTLIGKLVGRAREGVTDDEVFRRHVRAQIATNKSDGLIEDVLKVADLIVYDDAASYIIDNRGPAAFALEVSGVGLDAALTATLLGFLRRAVAAGVRIIGKTWPSSLTGDLFTTDDEGGGDTGGAGFADAVPSWDLEKTGGINGDFDAGASSVETIAGDGYVEFIGASTEYRILGLSAADTSLSRDEIDYGIYLRADGFGASFIEQGGAQTQLGEFVATESTWRIERVGTTVRAYFNGALVHTYGVASSGPLLIDTAFFNSGAAFRAIRLVDAGRPVRITWQNATNVTATELADYEAGGGGMLTSAME